MSQTKKIVALKNKLLKQWELSKWKVRKQYDSIVDKRTCISIQDVGDALHKYSTFGIDLNDEQESVWGDKLNGALTTLNKEEMLIVRRRFFEATSLEAIANECGHFGDHKWSTRRIEQILNKLRDSLNSRTP